MTSLSIAYMFTCLGFCLGFVACAILRAERPAETSRAEEHLHARSLEGAALANVKHQPYSPDRGCACPRSTDPITGSRQRAHRDACPAAATPARP